MDVLTGLINDGHGQVKLDSRNMNSKFLRILTVTCYWCVCEVMNISMGTVVATMVYSQCVMGSHMVCSKLSLNIHGFALLFCMFSKPKGPSQCILFILSIRLQIRGFAFLFIHSVKHSHVKNYKFLLLVLKGCLCV